MTAKLSEDKGEFGKAIKAYRRVTALLPEDANHGAIQYSNKKLRIFNHAGESGSKNAFLNP